ncbi:MAG: hypothetical protein ACRD0K_19160 [Egibacteraceae bacterium]
MSPIWSATSGARSTRTIRWDCSAWRARCWPCWIPGAAARSTAIRTPTCRPGTSSCRRSWGSTVYETSALLTVLAELAGDDVARARARARREVAGRGHALPVWLDGLHTARADRAVELVHVLGDGDNVMVGVRLPGGHELSVVVAIDHNMGSLVSDASAVPEPLSELIARMAAASPDPDITCRDIDPADARARISEAVKFGAITVRDRLLAGLPPAGRVGHPAAGAALLK